MKVEIITLHRVTNFGSMLQTYATQTVVEQLGYKAEILDFFPEGLTFKRAVFPKGNGLLLKKMLKLIPLIVCNAAQFTIVNRFIHKYINVSHKKYYTYEQILADIPVADMYLSGSDQVWNTQNNNPEKDIMAYYLCFAPKDKSKIAYAGSFGKKNFSNEEKDKISKWLEDYDAISVREDDALKTLNELGIKNGIHVLDPTLLLSSSDWQSFCNKGKPRDGYVFVYNLNRNRTVTEIAKIIAKKKNLRIVNFADTFNFISGAENKVLNTPIDFLKYISNADFVVTDSFHGTAFSLNFHREFISVPAPKYNSRLESILKQVGLLDSRFIKNTEDFSFTDNEKIDYEKIDCILSKARENSIAFLREAFEKNET